MMNTTSATIADIVRRNASISDLGSDDDFFTVGISSLTVVSMQMEIEKALNYGVATKDLMKNPTISGWSEIYSAASK